jgi:DNA-binding NarL/FixJ family response regulator
MVRVFIVEDHPFMREMLREFIGNEADLEVCDEAGEGDEALGKIEKSLPDVVLIDVSLPGMSGLELVGLLHGRFPDLPCAMLSGHGERSYVDQALAAGARGYILKDNPDVLPGAIRQIVSGEPFLSVSLEKHSFGA